MRAVWILAIVAISVCGNGCKKDLTASDFPLQAGQSADQIIEMIGTPTKTAPHWIAYTLKDKTELRLFFLEGPRGGIRTLTEAAVYNAQGSRLKTVFQLPTTHSATKPAQAPVTRPTS